MIERIRPSTWALGIGGAALLAYEAFCPEGELISERCDEWVEHPLKRLALEAGLAAVALHLCNRVPERWDAIHHIAKLKPRGQNGRENTAL